MSGIINANDQTFEQAVLQSPLPVLVDFWAPWCGPCKMIAPLLEDLQNKLAGKLSVVKINVDDNKEVATQFGVRGIPTLLLFKNGELADTHVGMASIQQLEAFVNNHI